MAAQYCGEGIVSVVVTAAPPAVVAPPGATPQPAGPSEVAPSPADPSGVGTSAAVSPSPPEPSPQKAKVPRTGKTAYKGPKYTVIDADPVNLPPMPNVRGRA